MDELRVKAYRALIEQLLDCPQGKEEGILQKNLELINADLLKLLMNQSALSQENQKIIHVLSQVIGMLEDANTFLLNTLQLIAESQGNPQQVYRYWVEHKEKLDTVLLNILPYAATKLYQENESQLSVIASDLANFATFIQPFTLSPRKLNIELSIAANEQALLVYTREVFPLQWATIQNNLAYDYINRLRGDRVDNIEQAIKACEAALQIRTFEVFPKQWAVTQNNLGLAYFYRIRGDRADNIEQAVKACEAALCVFTCETFPLQWATAQNDLAVAYTNRIRGDRADNIEQALTACREALKVHTRDASPFSWAMTQNNLGNAYSDRLRGDPANNLEQAIQAYEQALQVYTRDHAPEHWATTQHNLATAYSNRILGEPSDNIEQALDAYQQALQIYTYNEYPLQWAEANANLASVYIDRILGEPSDNIEQAINGCQKALQIYTQNDFPEKWAMAQSNLGFAYEKRIQGELSDNLQHAISAYELALQILTPEALPFSCHKTSCALGNLHFKQHNWVAASTAYTNALAATENLYQSSILLDSKAAELSEIDDLPRRTAYVLARAGNLEKALETLEQFRARNLSENLDRYRSDLSQLQQNNPELYAQYKDLTAQIRNIENRQRERLDSYDFHSIASEGFRESAIGFRQALDDLFREVSQVPGYESFLAFSKRPREIAIPLHNQLKMLIQEIRQVPTYENFLTLLTFADVQNVATLNCPLIYLLATPAGSLALLVTPDDIQSIWLDTFTEPQLLDLLNVKWFSGYKKWINAIQQLKANPSEENRRIYQQIEQDWHNVIDTTTHQLWEPIIAPVIKQLKTMGCDRAILIPTGYLSLLPLHAAWTEDPNTPTGRHYALDDIHFTYAPNARSLSAAQEIATRTTVDSILAIDNPRNDLSNSAAEVQAAISRFSQPIHLLQNQATIKTVKTELPKVAIAHFSCHGNANLSEPLTSGLQMSDGLLTLKDILALNLAEHGGLRLAVLSACETGLIGLKNADEAIGLPTGLLQAGVAGVVASLWSVSDLSTSLLLAKFYELWQVEKIPVDRSLRQAQIWLRDSTEGEIAPLLGRRTRTPDRLPFSHPYYWSAFTYTGV